MAKSYLKHNFQIIHVDVSFWKAVQYSIEKSTKNLITSFDFLPPFF